MPTQPNQDSLHHCLQCLYQGRRALFIGGLIGTIIAALLIVAAIPATRAVMTLTPAHTLNDNAELGTQSTSASSASAALFQALSSVTSTPQNAYFQEFLLLYPSDVIAQRLLQDPIIQHGLTQDRRFTILPARSTWTAPRLSAYLSKHVRAQTTLSGDFKEISYWHPDPDFALYFLSQLHALTDQAIKARAQDSAEKRKAYLQQQWNSTQNAQHQKVINTLMLEQERTLMLSAIDEPFAAKMVIPPSAAYKAGWPAKPFILLLGLFIGMSAGYGLHRLHKLGGPA